MSKHETGILPQHGSRPSPMDGDPAWTGRSRTIRMEIAATATHENLNPGRIAILSSVVDLVSAFVRDWRERRRLVAERSRADREIAALDDHMLQDAGLPPRPRPTVAITVDRFMAPPHAAGAIASARDMFPKRRD